MHTAAAAAAILQWSATPRRATPARTAQRPRGAHLGQRGADEVARPLGHPGREGRLLVHDEPVRLLAALLLKGRPPHQQLVGQHAAGPHVHRGGVAQQHLLLRGWVGRVGWGGHVDLSLLLWQNTVRLSTRVWRLTPNAAPPPPSQPPTHHPHLVLLRRALLGAAQHLGRHVVQRAGARNRPLLAAVDGQPKVGHLERPVAHQQDVLGLNVPAGSAGGEGGVSLLLMHGGRCGPPRRCVLHTPPPHPACGAKTAATCASAPGPLSAIPHLWMMFLLCR